MYRLIALAIWIAAPGIGWAGDRVSDFDMALSRWKSAAIENYTFTYEDNGGGLITPKCGDAQFKLKVRKGVGGIPVVVSGASPSHSHLRF
jgi:hypothetical protein